MVHYECALFYCDATNYRNEVKPVRKRSGRVCPTNTAGRQFAQSSLSGKMYLYVKCVF